VHSLVTRTYTYYSFFTSDKFFCVLITCLYFNLTIMYISVCSHLVTSPESWKWRRTITQKKFYEEFIVFWVTDFAEDGTCLVCRSVVLVWATGRFCFFVFCCGRTLSWRVPDEAKTTSFEGGYSMGYINRSWWHKTISSSKHKHEEETVDISGKDANFNVRHRNYLQIFLVSLLRLGHNSQIKFISVHVLWS
jgi:hypothetical protein